MTMPAPTVFSHAESAAEPRIPDSLQMFRGVLIAATASALLWGLLATALAALW